MLPKPEGPTRDPLFEGKLHESPIHSGRGQRLTTGTLSSFRTEHGAEVDFIVETRKDTWAIEVKASKSIGRHDLRGLKRFRDFHGKKCGAAVLYLGTVEKLIEGIEILPWQVGLARMAL